MGIAYRRALKTLRSRGHQLYDAVPLEDETLVAPDELAEGETGEWILLAMQQLPLEQRLALEYAYGYGHSCEEIAKIMDCPANTVKTRLFHGRAKLRALLPRLGGLEP
jgi:RNA polymerase sigma-70 factor (ECF subfamily)